jgi:hypothetical protein
MLDVDMRIGDLDVPRGEYTLFLLPREDGGELILSDETRQWGTDYDPTRDFGRTLLRRREVAEPLESLAITLELALRPRPMRIPELYPYGHRVCEQPRGRATPRVSGAIRLPRECNQDAPYRCRCAGVRVVLVAIEE